MISALLPSAWITEIPELSSFKLYFIVLINVVLAYRQGYKAFRSFRARTSNATSFQLPSSFLSLLPHLQNAIVLVLGLVAYPLRTIAAFLVYTLCKPTIAPQQPEETIMQCTDSMPIKKKRSKNNKNKNKQRGDKKSLKCIIPTTPTKTKAYPKHEQSSCPTSTTPKPFRMPEFHQAPLRPLNTATTLYYSVKPEVWLRASPPRSDIQHQQHHRNQPPLPPSTPTRPKTYVDKELPLKMPQDVCWMSPEGLGRSLAEKQIREIRKMDVKVKVAKGGCTFKFPAQTGAPTSSGSLLDRLSPLQQPSGSGSSLLDRLSHPQQPSGSGSSLLDRLSPPQQSSSSSLFPVQPSSSLSWLDEIPSSADVVKQKKAEKKKGKKKDEDEWTPPAWLENFGNAREFGLLPPVPTPTQVQPSTQTLPMHVSPMPTQMDMRALPMQMDTAQSMEMEMTPPPSYSSFPSSEVAMDTTPDAFDTYSADMDMDVDRVHVYHDQPMHDLPLPPPPPAPTSWPEGPTVTEEMKQSLLSQTIPHRTLLSDMLPQATPLPQTRPLPPAQSVVCSASPQPSSSAPLPQVTRVSGNLDAVPARPKTPEAVTEFLRSTIPQPQPIQSVPSSYPDEELVPTQPNTPRIPTLALSGDLDDPDSDDESVMSPGDWMSFIELVIEITPPLPPASYTMHFVDLDILPKLPWLGKSFEGELGSEPSKPPPGFQFHPAPESVTSLARGYKFWASFLEVALFDSGLHHLPFFNVDRKSESYSAKKVNEGLLERMFWGLVDLKGVQDAAQKAGTRNLSDSRENVLEFLDGWKMRYLENFMRDTTRSYGRI